VVFFVRSRGDHRAPLSFPTRRSSDLADQLQQLVVVGAAAQRAAQVHPGLRKQAGVEDAVGGQPRARAAAAEGLRDRGDESHLALDRKSTRLNSSHVKISYAVFCLKKK